MNFEIRIKDINLLSPTEMTTIYNKLSWKNANTSGSMRDELEKRYIRPTTGPRPPMPLAMVWQNGVFVCWVGTRSWPEMFKGEKIVAQTIECFTAPEYRRNGLARMGLQALISAGVLNREAPVSVYAPEVLPLARQCGCKVVLLCEAT